MYEYYAPSFSIELEGETLEHGTNVDVLSVSVTENANEADSFSISLRDRHAESGRFASGAKLYWMDHEGLQEGKKVKISMGYVNDMRTMMQGEITAVAPSFPESGQPSINVRGFSLYHRLQRERRREPFKATTDSGIAREVASALGLTPEVDDTSAEQPLVSPNGETYHAILSQRAQRIGFELAVKLDKLYFKKPGYIEKPDPELTLEWGRSLKRFSPKLSTYGLYTEVTVRGPQTSHGGGKDPLVGTAAAGDERQKLGSQSASEIAKSNFKENKINHPDHNVSSQEEAKDVAVAKLEEKSLGFITGSGSCMGHKDLQARTVVEIKGVGERFSGNYYVTQVTHTIDAGGYRSEFKVKRNAL